MDEVLQRRLVGVLTLGIAAFLLSWLLPRPGLERLQGGAERVVTMDLTRADSLPEEVLRAEDIVYAEDEQPTGPVVGDDSGVSVSAVDQMPAQDPANDSVDDTAAALANDATSATLPPQDAEPAPQAEPAITPEPEAKPIPKPEPEPKPEPKPKPKPQPAPKPEPKPEPATVKQPVKPVPAPAASGAAKMLVQAGAYSHLDKAEDVRARSKALGISCVISPGENAKGTLYRVRCGPYPSREAAEAVVKKLSAASIAAAVVPGA
ncbi:MAG: SPOR domain-containing protein [Panacagrimonas sp.]